MYLYLLYFMHSSRSSCLTGVPLKFIFTIFLEKHGCVFSACVFFTSLPRTFRKKFLTQTTQLVLNGLIQFHSQCLSHCLFRWFLFFSRQNQKCPAQMGELNLKCEGDWKKLQLLQQRWLNHDRKPRSVQNRMYYKTRPPNFQPVG